MSENGVSNSNYSHIYKKYSHISIMNPVNRNILRLAIPSIVSNITVPLLGLVDLTIVGHMGDARYISAVAIGTMIFNSIYWLTLFLRMGTSGMTAQAFGAQDRTEVLRILQRTLFVGLFLGVLLLMLSPLLRPLLIYLMSTPPDAVVLVETYFDIVIFGAPAMLALYGLTGWFVGMQDTRTPMWVAIFQNVVNIVFGNFYFAFDKVNEFYFIFYISGRTEAKDPRHTLIEHLLDILYRTVTPFSPFAEVTEVCVFLFLQSMHLLQFFFRTETRISLPLQNKLFCVDVINCGSLALTIRTVIARIGVYGCSLVKMNAVMLESFDKHLNCAGNFPLFIRIFNP